MKKRELFSKFNKMSEDEISKELANLYAEARKTRLDIESKKSTKTSDISQKKVQIAQLLTVLNNR
jgi:ribosomal protein L29